MLLVQEFHHKALQEFKSLKQQSELMDQRFEELSKYFCFDRKKMSMEEFFGDLTTFFKDFEVHVYFFHKQRLVLFTFLILKGLIKFFLFNFFNFTTFSEHGKRMLRLESRLKDRRSRKRERSVYIYIRKI